MAQERSRARRARSWFPRPRRAGRHGPITRTLRDLGRGLRQPPGSVGAVIDRLGPEGLGLAVLLLTLPTLIPVPGPLGMVLGTLLALLSLQVLAGASRLWLPEAIRRRPAPSRTLRAAIAGALPWVGHAESVLRERRMSVLTGRRARILLALPVLALALVITLPIPFGNAVPAVALIVIALGLMARDGVAILCGLGISVVALAWTGLLVFAGAAMLELALALLP